MSSARSDSRDMVPVIDSPVVSARQALRFAMDFASSRLGGDETVAERLKAGNQTAHGYFRYGLARALAGYLATTDGTVKAVYLYDGGSVVDEVEAEPLTVTTPLSLIVVVSRPSAASAGQVEAIDAALTREYVDLVFPQANQLHSLLDVEVITNRDVDENVGYGVVIHSLLAKPTKVWPD